MKKQSIFFGVLLVGFGIFFLVDELNLKIAEHLYTWPLLLVLVGVALGAQCRISQDYSNVLASYILITLGGHFYVSDWLPFWPQHTSMVILMIALSFLLSAKKSKTGLFQGILLLLIALFMMFSNNLNQFAPAVENGVNYLATFWPILFLLIGLYLLFSKRK
ncbi:MULTISPECIES: LiaF transmembrane domain-containing protein [Priestia]|uniref:LiaF transmembrane domain-containing protein n=1 Tax=Priestia veravalensis TaxID=1414648 RepID=A0A0V8JNG1_9BACI|nr:MULTISPECIES: DUF5668 domain-containing protein [Priestia]KSU88550.1 hypothetical protein AS180_07260 [Priestia veravalensis]SCC10627.1 hypothetical protein GA0061087_101219 [Priestia flexa]